MTDEGTPAPESAAPLPQGFNPWRGRIALLTMVHTVGTACYLSVMAMGPVIRGDLGITAAEFGFFMSAVFGAQLFSALPSGSITDRMGVGWTLFGATMMSSTGAVLFALSVGFYQALAAAFLMGLGYSFVNPATAKGVVRWFPAQWRGTAMGLKQLGVPLGGVLGAGGGVMAAYMDWRIVMWTAAGITFAVAMLCLPLTRKPVHRVGGLVAILGDLKTVMTNRNMNAICASCVMFNTGQSSLFTYLALFLRDAAGASQPLAATGVAVAQTACAFGRVGYTYLSDRVFGARRKGIVIAVVLAGVGSCAVAYFVAPGWPHWALLALAAIMGGTLAAYAALILSMTAESVPSSLVGSAIGYNALAWSVGGTVGPPLFGLVLDHSGNDYGLGWLAMGAIMLIGVIIIGTSFKERTDKS